MAQRWQWQALKLKNEIDVAEDSDTTTNQTMLDHAQALKAFSCRLLTLFHPPYEDALQCFTIQVQITGFINQEST